MSNYTQQHGDGRNNGRENTRRAEHIDPLVGFIRRLFFFFVQRIQMRINIQQSKHLPNRTKLTAFTITKSSRESPPSPKHNILN